MSEIIDGNAVAKAIHAELTAELEKVGAELNVAIRVLPEDMFKNTL
jgi:hypothetical protein